MSDYTDKIPNPVLSEKELRAAYAKATQEGDKLRARQAIDINGTILVPKFQTGDKATYQFRLQQLEEKKKLQPPTWTQWLVKMIGGSTK
jgi:hypothetical protein